MAKLSFPDLFNDSDRAAARAQSAYFRLLAIEYAILVLAAVLIMGPFQDVPFITFYPLLFLASLAVVLARTLRKPEQDWYRCRALAESIKTATWRYAMRAEPFDDSRAPDGKAKFLKFLGAIVDSNRHAGNPAADLNPEGQQITTAMDEIRALMLDARKQIYLSDRIRDQRAWYTGKAKGNRRSQKVWAGVCVVVYLTTAVLSFYRMRLPDLGPPVELLLVVAASLLGWVQIRRYFELASAYALTAHEIGIIEAKIGTPQTEQAFSAFVNEAELAFSREHTQWVARLRQA